MALVTGAIGSGKTTRLVAWAQGRGDVGGIVSPVLGGRRVFVDLVTQDTCQMERRGAVRILEVGRYRFDAAAFAWAARRLELVAGDPTRQWLVLDELGPLELKGAGLAPAVEIVLSARHVTPVLVIRDGLVEPMLERFGLLPEDVRVFDWPRG